MIQPIHIYKVPDRNLMLAFEAETSQEAWAGNAAIRKVLRDNDFRPFYQAQAQVIDTNAPGFHVWEVWRKVTEDFLAALIPYVNEEAAKLMEIY